jgi:hypothetical protein
MRGVWVVTFKKTAGSDYFGTFLDTVGGPSAQAEESGATAQQSPPASLPTQVRKLLANAGPRSLSEIATQLDQPLLATATVVQGLVDAGLVAVEGPPGQEQYSLSENGRKLAALE